MVNKPQVTIYTDGGCEPNPGIGGWAAVMLSGDHRKELFGGELDTTNNRMELRAAIEALKTLKRSCSVTVYTDSQYVRLGITQWMAQWKAKGWKRKTGAIKNIDLWRELDELSQHHQIEWGFPQHLVLFIPENSFDLRARIRVTAVRVDFPDPVAGVLNQVSISIGVG